MAEEQGTGGANELSPTEVTSLDLEIISPTGIPHSSTRMRAEAARTPGELLVDLADQLADELMAIVLREARRREEAFALRPPIPGSESERRNGDWNDGR